MEQVETKASAATDSPSPFGAGRATTMTRPIAAHERLD